jgi:DNA-binding NarL/FixJ family response regulator
MPRILIVDDHPFVRRGVRSILRPFPEWELCGEAENGDDAIRIAEALKPKVVIMDISMPGISGIDAARTIHKTSPDTKIILLTLHESPELVRSAFRAGAQAYILKVDAERELIKALGAVLADSMYISSKIKPEVARSVIREMFRPRSAPPA